ncbi:lipocalin family protein [Xanthomarina sp. F2636L]|uniref:lipocalin family protein n=1 Tax=Xanthomarina sp. F2636L TaxID=2996018 RepID=UPI00225E1561|nr:lipocalin family protein [Xanthomarina sp. F2636L]MCX7551509.1 lipocalin family protein [Xanthomarina sp. F2636L]
MKHLILLVFSVCLLSCGGSKTVRDSKKVIKGEWTLNSISYSEAGTYNTTLFNDESKTCFEGSTWQFIPNNNTGLYTINNLDCTMGERYFVFTIQEIDETTGLYDFLLKPTNKKGKSETNQGFRLRLSALSDTNMQWQQTVMVDNKPFTINMNFTK